MKLFAFLSGIMNYWMIDVIQKSWAQFEKEALNVDDFGRLLDNHNSFIDYVHYNITLQV